MRIWNAVPVTHQSTGRDPLAATTNGRERMMSGERHDLIAAAVKEWIGADHKGIRALPFRRVESCVNLGDAAGGGDMQLLRGADLTECAWEPGRE
jgi:hypothetical protein